MVQLLKNIENVSNFQIVSEKCYIKSVCKNTSEKKDLEKVTATFTISQPVLSWAIEQAKHSAIPSKSLPILESWLAGDKIPTYNKIKEVSHDTHIPFGYFFLKKTPVEKIELLEYRTIKDAENNTPSRDLIEIIRTMEQIVSWTRRDLLIQDAQRCPVVGMKKETNSISSIVSFILSSLELQENWFTKSTNANDSFKKLREKISNLGIIVMQDTKVRYSNSRILSVDEFRAFTIIDDYSPLIFINAKDSENGKLFSLLHEYAHICLGKNNLFNDRYNDSKHVTALEKVCNAVAAEILVPRKIFDERWLLYNKNEPNTLDVITKLSKFFRCSRLVIAKKAYDLGKIDYLLYKKVFENSVNRTVNKSESGPGFYKTLASHMDKRFFTLLYSSVLEGRTQYTDAFRLTNTNRNTFEGLAMEYQL